MHITIEQEFVLLYALYRCGRKPSKARATQFIIGNHLMKEREGDWDSVSTGESKMENHIAWIRQNLKTKCFLSMPDHGIWAITQKGVDVIEKVALRSLTWEKTGDPLQEIHWEIFSNEFLEGIKALGAEVEKRQEEKCSSAS